MVCMNPSCALRQDARNTQELMLGEGGGEQKSNKNPSQAMKLKDTNSPVKGI